MKMSLPTIKTEILSSEYFLDWIQHTDFIDRVEEVADEIEDGEYGGAESLQLDSFSFLTELPKDVISLFLVNHNIFESHDKLQQWLSVESDEDLTDEGDSAHDDPNAVEEKRSEWFDGLRNRLFTYW